MSSVESSYRTLFEYDPSNSLISTDLELKKGTTLVELKKELRSWSFTHLLQFFDVFHWFSKNYDAKETAEAVNRFVLENKDFFYTKGPVDLQTIAQKLTELESKISRNVQKPSVQIAKNAIDFILDSILREQKITAEQQQAKQEQIRLKHENKQKHAQIAAENTRKLESLGKEYGKDTLQVLFQKYPNVQKIFQSDAEVISEKQFAAIQLQCKTIHRETQCKAKLQELQSRIKTMREDQKATVVSEVIRELHSLAKKYPELAQRTQSIEQALKIFVKGEAVFSEIPFEENLMKRLGQPFDKVKNEEIGKRKWQDFRNFLISKDWYSDPFDYSTKEQQCRKEAFQERLNSYALSPTQRQEVSFFLIYANRLYANIKKSLKENLLKTIASYEKKCPGFSELLSKYDYLAPEELIEVFSKKFERNLLDHIDPIDPFKSLTEFCRLAKADSQGNMEKVFFTTTKDSLRRYAKKQYDWMSRNAGNIKVSYCQGKEISLNANGGTCFANSLERHKTLSIHPALSAEEIPMGSTTIGRLMHVKDSFEITTSREGFVRSFGFTVQNERYLIDRGSRKDNIQRLLTEGLNFINANGSHVAVLVMTERHSSGSAAGHAINIQYDTKRQIFRIIDDNVGIIEFKSAEEFKKEFLNYLKVMYPEYGDFEILTPRIISKQ